MEKTMKKIIFLFLLSFVFLISCGGGDDSSAPQNFNSDSEKEQEQDDPQKDEDKNEEGDTEEAEDTEEETETDEDTAPEEEPGQPDEDQNTPQVETVGNFSLNFSGTVHQSVSMNDMTNLGGSGVANFVYNNQPITFGEINIGIKLFPLAMVNNGIIIVWLDSFKATEAMTTAHKQVFGINLPQNTEVGSGDMASANIYAFYGDMTVNVQQQLFSIDCVRSVTNVGNYEVMANDGTNISLTASGDLLDPSAGAAYLDYPACQ